MTETITKTSEDDISLYYLHTVPKTKIKDGDSLIELTIYDDIAMWWFVDIGFCIYINQLVNCMGHKKAQIENRSLIGHLKKSSFLYFMYELFASSLCKLNIKLYGSKTSHKNRVLVETRNRQWNLIQDSYTKELKKGDEFFRFCNIATKKK